MICVIFASTNFGCLSKRFPIMNLTSKQWHMGPSMFEEPSPMQTHLPEAGVREHNCQGAHTTDALLEDLLPREATEWHWRTWCMVHSRAQSDLHLKFLQDPRIHSTTPCCINNPKGCCKTPAEGGAARKHSILNTTHRV